MASLLLYTLTPGWASCRYHAPGAQRYSAGVRSFIRALMDHAGAGPTGWSGWFSGQSGTRSAGGLITAQLANDMVRDHRNSPVLLVMSNWPNSWKKNSAYPATGIANAARQAVKTFQPTRMISRKARMITMTGAPLPRMTAAQATSSPTMTACQMAARAGRAGSRRRPSAPA